MQNEKWINKSKMITVQLHSEISIEKIMSRDSSDSDKVKIHIKNLHIEDSTEVDFEDFYRCMKELGLNNIDHMKHEFKSVCDWFMKQKQYVDFEEITIVGSAT